MQIGPVPDVVISNTVSFGRMAADALKADPNRATEVARKLFPPTEASLISELIRRDLPFYDPGLSRGTIESMNRFARDIGLLSNAVAYEKVVASVE